MNGWYKVTNAAEVASPALLIYPDRVEHNLREIVRLVGNVARLRPHVKTHKIPEIVRLQVALGITKFKAATIAEAEMTALAGAEHVLLAYQPVGPTIARMLALMAGYPQTGFAAIVDNAATASAISAAAVSAGAVVELWLDIDCGMHRTGATPGPAALELYRLVSSLPGLRAGGLHVYDGHICDRDLAARRSAVAEAMAPVTALMAELRQAGLAVPHVVAGGSPTFALHAERGADVECSPGTCVLWDAGYGAALQELPFVAAAAMLIRVISKPGTNRLCLDLGYKAIASEGAQPHVILFGLEDAIVVGHNEEHLVLETPRAAEYHVGDVVYGVPWHICPTVAMHARATVVRGGRAVEQWRVVARDRRLNF